MSHINVEELLDFIFAKKINEEFVQMAARINSHLYVCPQCFEKHRTLCGLKDSLGTLGTIREDAQKRILKTIYKQDTQSALFNDLINDLLKKTSVPVQYIPIKVNSFKELSILDNSSDFLFRNPEIASDILVDDDDNEISISSDGLLSVKMKKSRCSEGSAVYLVPANAEADVLVDIAKPLSDEEVCLSYNVEEPDDYEIIL